MRGPLLEHRRRSLNPTWETHVCTSSDVKKEAVWSFHLSRLFSPFVNFDKNTQVKSKQIKSTCFNLYFCNFPVFGRHGFSLWGAHSWNTGGGPLIRLGKPNVCTSSDVKKEALWSFHLSRLFSTFVNFDKNTQVKSKQIKSTRFNLYFCNFRVFGRHGFSLWGAHS